MLIGSASIAAAHAQTQQPTTEAQARYYVYGAFLTQAVPQIMSEEVALGPELEQRLGVQSGGDRVSIYNALVSLTDGKPISVRKATTDEIAKYAVRSKRELKDPLFTLRAGDVTLLVQYDMQANTIPFVGGLALADQAAQRKPPVVERAAPAPIAAPAPEPAPAAALPAVPAPVIPPAPAAPAPVAPAPLAPAPVAAPKPTPPPARVAAPIVTAPAEKPRPTPAPIAAPLPKPTGPCVVKPVMSDEDLINCGARPR